MFSSSTNLEELLLKKDNKKDGRKKERKKITKEKLLHTDCGLCLTLLNITSIYFLESLTHSWFCE